MTAAIPVITALAPQIITLITALVHRSAPAQEALGTGTGPVKFANVFSDVISALQKAALAGQIDKTLPADETVKLIIQAVVASMQIGGMLVAPASASAPQAIALVAGQSVVVSAK